jgi:hypothetical protein
MSKNKRRKFDASPLDLDEMERDPSLGGLSEYLSTLLTGPSGAAPATPGELLAPGSKPANNLGPAPKDLPGPTVAADVGLAAPDNLIPPSNMKGVRVFPIREAKLAQEGHSRAEQQLYESVWEHGRPHDAVSRVITIGFGTLGRMSRMAESNARINLRSLIRKLAVEEHAPYDCERNQGRTYRVFDYDEILRRRAQAGLRWYCRRTLAVVFVDRRTGEPLDLARFPQSSP